MWVQRINNYLCNYLDQYKVQKKHIERVLCAKDNINDSKPYYPKFLQLRLGKNQFEEEKNNKIKEENKNLFYKIENAITKPSKYSKIYEPKDCPSFNKQMIGLKRIKKQLEHYQENMRFYNKIENVKSFYDKKDINKRNITIDINIKKLHKTIFELQPSLFFLSPLNVKNGMKKIKYTSFNKTKIKRCNSCSNRYEPKKNFTNNFTQIKNVSRTNRQYRMSSEKTSEKSNQFNTHRTIEKYDKLKKILNNPIKNKNKTEKNKSNKDRNKNKTIEKNINIGKKFNSSYDNNSNNIKDINKMKINKNGLKRNASEFNIFKYNILNIYYIYFMISYIHNLLYYIIILN